MGIAIRFYLFSDDGLQRISHRLMDGLARGKDAMPQYAGTKQKIANVIVEMENGKPVELGRADGSFLTFDEAGQVHKDLIASGIAAMETYRALERTDQTPAGTVIDLSPKLNREKWERENRWTPSKEDLDAICDDIWKRKRAAAPKVVQAKGIAPKPVTLSYEAKEAIREIQKQVWGIGGKLEHLTEATSRSSSAAWSGESPGGGSDRAISTAWCLACGSVRSFIQPCSSHSRMAPASNWTEVAHLSMARVEGLIIGIEFAPLRGNESAKPFCVPCKQPCTKIALRNRLAFEELTCRLAPISA
jgi:hypothetical protein